MLVAFRTAKTAMPCVFVIIISDVQIGNLDQLQTIICWEIRKCVYPEIVPLVSVACLTLETEPHDVDQWMYLKYFYTFLLFISSVV